MSYTKTIWKNGDIVTSALLNKIENEIDEIANNSNGSNLLVTDTYDPSTNTITLSETFDVIKSVIDSGNIVWWEVTSNEAVDAFGRSFLRCEAYNLDANILAYDGRNFTINPNNTIIYELSLSAPD